MTTLAAPYPLFTDRDGRPLENGTIYVGVANQNPLTSPLTVYWDDAETMPTGPLRTMAGYIVRNGTAAAVYSSLDYSIAVYDKNGELVFSRASLGTVGGVITAEEVEFDSSPSLPFDNVQDAIQGAYDLLDSRVDAAETAVAGLAVDVAGKQDQSDILDDIADASYATGDILYAPSAGVLGNLGAGTNGQVLTLASGVPSWAALPASGGMTLLATLSTASGATVTQGGLTLTSYKQMLLVINDVSVSAGGGHLQLGAGGLQFTSAGSATDSYRGHLWVDLSSGIFSASVVPMNTGSTDTAISVPYSGKVAWTNATTSITFDTSAGNFDAGSILIYGVQ